MSTEDVLKTFADGIAAISMRGDVALVSATSDGPADEPSLRTLGSGSGQAAPGDDPRFSVAEGKFTALDVNLRSAGQTVVVPVSTGKRFVCTSIILEIKTATGTPGTYAVVRIGVGGSYDSVAPSFIVNELTVGALIAVPQVVPPLSVSVNTTPVSFDVQTAASGGSVSALTADVQLLGFLV